MSKISGKINSYLNDEHLIVICIRQHILLILIMEFFSSRNWVLTRSPVQQNVDVLKIYSTGLQQIVAMKNIVEDHVK